MPESTKLLLFLQGFGSKQELVRYSLGICWSVLCFLASLGQGRAGSLAIGLEPSWCLAFVFSSFQALERWLLNTRAPPSQPGVLGCVW